MGRNIDVERANRVSVEDEGIELVERKGIGHPDSIADGIAESVSRKLCQEYLDRYGAILHHNTDETQIVAGRSSPGFGGGEVIDPIYILLTGRATNRVGDDQFPANRIALKAARGYLKENMRNLDLEGDVVVDSRLGEGSADLKTVFDEKESIHKANDTSFGVAHAPFSDAEAIVLDTERSVCEWRGKDLKEVGEDVKVMGLRRGDEIRLTVAAALVSPLIDDVDHYRSVVEELGGRVVDNALKQTEREVSVLVNTADSYADSSLYLTVTGTSAEMGDDGSVGRGNRSNGLITPNRPMSMEATSGKNPVSHVGKIYNLLSGEIASDIADSVEGVREVYVRILSQIGESIDNPQTANAQLVLEEGYSLDDVKSKVEATVDIWLDDVTQITDMVVRDELSTF